MKTIKPKTIEVVEKKEVNSVEDSSVVLSQKLLKIKQENQKAFLNEVNKASQKYKFTFGAQAFITQEGKIATQIIVVDLPQETRTQ